MNRNGGSALARTNALKSPPDIHPRILRTPSKFKTKKAADGLSVFSLVIGTGQMDKLRDGSCQPRLLATPRVGARPFF